MLSARKCLRKAACCAGPPSVASVLAVTVLLKPVPWRPYRFSTFVHDVSESVDVPYRADPKIGSTRVKMIPGT